MMNIYNFLEVLSKNCLKKNYAFHSDFNSDCVRSFFLTKKGKKTKFTTKFDGTFLEDCQTTIFVTNDIYITPLEVAKELITKIDSNKLSNKGKNIRRLLK